MDLKDPKTFRLIGRDVPRWDIPAKTSGSATYSIDVRLPNMVYATVVRAPVLGAKVLSVNDGEISKLPNVLKVVKYTDRAAIVARTYEAALAGERDLKISWSKAPADNFDSDRALEEHAAVAHDLDKPGFPAHKRGDVAPALKSAAKIYEAEYRTEFVYHAQMEPLNSVASVKDAGKSVEIWAGTQAPTHLVRSVAQALGIAPEKVILHRTLLGGAFGRRAAQDHDWAVDSAVLSKEMARPVKVIWSRESDVRFGRFKPLTVEYIRAGEDAAGRLTAWHYRLVSDEALAMSDPLRFERGKQFPVIAAAGIETSYEFPNVLAEVVKQDNGLRISPVRGVGATMNLFAIEAFLDEIGTARGNDPIELRLDLLQHLPAAQDAIRAVAELAQWKKGEKSGRGVSFSSKGDAYLATIVQVTVDHATGVIRVPQIWVAADVGIPIAPRNLDAQIQGAAIHALSNLLKERITFKSGQVQESNFYDYLVLRIGEVPEVHTRILNSSRDPVGIGDVAGIGIAPAVASAFYSATGRRLRQTPFLPERVLAKLKNS